MDYKMKMIVVNYITRKTVWYSYLFVTLATILIKSFQFLQENLICFFVFLIILFSLRCVVSLCTNSHCTHCCGPDCPNQDLKIIKTSERRDQDQAETLYSKGKNSKKICKNDQNLFEFQLS